MDCRGWQNFLTEAEEARWWEANQDELAKEFESAVESGTLGRGTVARQAALQGSAVRLDAEDMLKAQAQAEQRGLTYQSYLKMLLHDALGRAEAPVHSAAAEADSLSEGSSSKS
ncbi:MAG TPA: hypothetical protein VGD59_11120 [Acidisarcina sp.]